MHCDRKRDENNERNKSTRREGSYASYMLSGKSAKKNRNVAKEGKKNRGEKIEEADRQREMQRLFL